MNIDPHSVVDHGEHPEVEEISALTEGVLPDDAAQRLRDHLADCPLCADVHDSLDEIRGLLGRLPGPPRMPADVAGRIDAALAAEALLAAAGSPAAPEADQGPGERGDAGPPRDATWAAGPRGAEGTPGHRTVPERAGAPTTTTGTPGSTVPGPRPAPRHPGGPTGPGGPPRRGGTGPGRSRRGRWRAGLLAAACTVALVGFGVFFLDLSNDASDDMDKGAAQKAFDATATTWVYTEGNIDSRVRDLLDPDRGARSEDHEEVQAPAESALPASPQSENGADHDLIGPDLPGCVLSATDRPGERPVATDEGEYQGRPVGVVVLPDPASEDRVNVYVVDSSCAGTASDEPGAVLLRRDVPRP